MKKIIIQIHLGLISFSIEFFLLTFLVCNVYAGGRDRANAINQALNEIETYKSGIQKNNTGYPSGTYYVSDSPDDTWRNIEAKHQKIASQAGRDHVEKFSAIAFGNKKINVSPSDDYYVLDDQPVGDALDNWEAIGAKHQQIVAEAEADHVKNFSKINFNDNSEVLLELPEEYARENVGVSSSRKHELDVNYQVSSYVYEEPHVMKAKGIFKGINANYAYRPNKNDFLYLDQLNYYALEGSFSWAKLKYEGIAQDGLRDSNIQDCIAELRGLFGREFEAKEFSATLYSGFGHRYLNDDHEDPFVVWNGARVYSYDRESRYYYIPLGVNVGRVINRQWDMNANLEYDVFLRGKQESHLGQVNPYLSGYEDVINRQNHGFGMRGSVEFARTGEKMDLVLEPFFEYWQIADSEPTTGSTSQGSAIFLEPENHTAKIGLNFGIKF